ncbi:transglycosylase SLT domain-containing protein [Rodentibacter caecimuris]|uniref:Lytic murein transglycosylase n=1 Tax=Rodentibacter caecimuris TaxID=1796644 RepID=A0ABX3KW04_9PAST|nr:hypothetical protein BKG89_07535 [Rodentibacter heylii]
MKKITTLIFSLLVLTCSTQTLSSSTVSSTKTTSKNLVSSKKMQEKASILEKKMWDKEQQDRHLTRLQQRETFLQLEGLLKTAVKTQSLSAQNESIIRHLLSQLQDYPLQQEIQAAYLEAKFKTADWENKSFLANLDQEIVDFIQRNPTHFQRSKLEQFRFSLLIAQNKLQTAWQLSKTVQPKGLDTQSALLNAQYQKEIQTHLSQSKTQSSEIQQILQEFEKLWLENTPLPDSLKEIQMVWEKKLGKTTQKIQQKYLRLLTKNDIQGLSSLMNEVADEETKKHISELQKLLKNPASLPQYINNSGNNINTEEKLAVFQTFSRYLRTQPEQISNPDFSRYQQWIAHYQLNENEIREWKIAFINRFFDNADPNFQQWRDQEILTLGADNLTERRIRTAILQKSSLLPWLQKLSPESQQKQEWRYWTAKEIAKIDTQKSNKILTALSQERGFYPMLAAYQLKKTYQLSFIEIEDLTQIEQEQFTSFLAEIDEWRTLGRFDIAKQRWRYQLEKLPPQIQRRLSRHVQNRYWFDLAVEGSIIAKAWDAIPLRLPNAYQNYFDAALQNLPIRRTFAMAIARQESAFNPTAQSHANARGLMQLLPTTAKQTAQRNQLPYENSNELFRPLNNIVLGTAHLAELNQKYPDNRILIAAAYNAGSSRVERWLERSSGKLTLDEFIATIPFYETRGYVQNVVAYDYYYKILQRQEKPQIFSQAESNRLY